MDQANYESRNLGPDRIKAPDKRREKHVFAEPVETKEIEKQTFSMSAAFASTRDAPEKEKGKEKNSSKDKKARRLKKKDSVEHGSYDAESPRAPVDRSNRAKVPPLKLTKESNDAISRTAPFWQFHPRLNLDVTGLFVAPNGVAEVVVSKEILRMKVNADCWMLGVSLRMLHGCRSRRG